MNVCWSESALPSLSSELWTDDNFLFDFLPQIPPPRGALRVDRWRGLQPSVGELRYSEARRQRQLGVQWCVSCGCSRGAPLLLLGGAGELLLIQAEDVMHKLVLLTGLDHPAPEGHSTGRQIRVSAHSQSCVRQFSFFNVCPNISIGFERFAEEAQIHDIRQEVFRCGSCFRV